MADTSQPGSVAPQGGGKASGKGTDSTASPSQQKLEDPRLAVKSEQELRAQIADAHMPPPVPDDPNAGKDYVPQDDSEAALLAPTSRPNEPITAGLSDSGQVAPPPDAYRWFPLLQQASQEPDAPPQLAVLARLLSSNLSF